MCSAKIWEALIPMRACASVAFLVDRIFLHVGVYSSRGTLRLNQERRSSSWRDGPKVLGEGRGQDKPLHGFLSFGPCALLFREDPLK